MANWVSAFFTIVIAIATVVYVAFTKKLWRETQRSADAAAKSAEAAVVASNAAKVSAESASALYRPFIGLTSLPSLNDPNSNDWMFPIELRNYGTLPALRVNAAFEFFLAERSLVVITRPESAEVSPNSPFETNLDLRLTTPDRIFLNAGAVLNLKLCTIYESPDGRKFEYKVEGPLGEHGRRFLLNRSETRLI
jgi:hypothetical protein